MAQYPTAESIGSTGSIILASFKKVQVVVQLSQLRLLQDVVYGSYLLVHLVLKVGEVLGAGSPLGERQFLLGFQNRSCINMGVFKNQGASIYNPNKSFMYIYIYVYCVCIYIYIALLQGTLEVSRNASMRLFPARGSWTLIPKP